MQLLKCPFQQLMRDGVGMEGDGTLVARNRRVQPPLDVAREAERCERAAVVRTVHQVLFIRRGRTIKVAKEAQDGA
jgi:hypothetical protein